MKFWSFAATLVSVSAGLSACHREKQPSASLKHTMDRPVFSAPVTLWQTLNPQELPEEREDGPRFVTDSSDPVLSRLQYWADAIVARLGDAVPADFPKIQVILDLSDEINAYTYGSPVCFGVPFGDPGASREVAGVQIYGGEVSEAESVLADRCPAPLRPAAELAPLIERLNTAFEAADPFHGNYPAGPQAKLLSEKYACRFVMKEGKLGTNGQCPDGWKSLRSNKVMLVLPTNRIVVHRGILAPLSEEEAISVLAHELGHVLHADSFRPEAERRYPYVQPEKNLTTEPPHSTDPRLAELVAQLSAKQVAFHYLPLPQEARLHPEIAVPNLFGFVQTLRYGRMFVSENSLGAVSAEACAAPLNCRPECRDLESTYEQSGLADSLYPMAAMAESDSAAYLKVENALFQCLSSVPAGSPLGARIFGELTDRVRDHQGTLSGHATVADAIAGLSQEFRDADSATELLQQEAAEVRLGVYTEEQMADEFATEAMAKLGLNPDSIASSNLKLWTARAESGLELPRNAPSRLRELSLEECEKARSEGWQSGNSMIYVPIGVLADSHHSVCYRVFNADAEVQAHGLQALSAGTEKYPLQSGQSWDELKSILESME